ncbi:hypothetical protein [Paenibacillus hamazuiensis]|nr:hypothetical protein [Paenibacillus hamazuiensis]
MAKTTGKGLENTVQINKEEIQAGKVQAKENYKMDNSKVDADHIK